MKCLLPIIIFPGIAVLPVLAAEAPRGAPAAEEDYAAVDAAINRTLTAIRDDLVKLDEAGALPQLDGIGSSRIERQEIGWFYNTLYHARAAQPDPDAPKSHPLSPPKFKFGENGCRIHVDLRSYDAESDPRFGRGAASASPPPHFQVRATGVPFGVEVSVEAEPTAAGKTFVERVNVLVNARLDEMKEELGAVPVDFSELVDRDESLDAAALEKEAFVVLEGTVTGHSVEVYEETGQPQRIQVKVTAILEEKPNHKGRLKVGDTIPVDPWRMKPVVEIPVGAVMKGYLSMGHVQRAPDDLRPFYYPVAPNAFTVARQTGREEWATCSYAVLCSAVRHTITSGIA